MTSYKSWRLVFILLCYIFLVTGNQDISQFSEHPVEEVILEADPTIEKITDSQVQSFTNETITNIDNDVEILESDGNSTYPIGTNNIRNSSEIRKLVSCKQMLINATEEERKLQEVELINSSRLTTLLTPDSEVSNKESEAHCMIVLFYSKLCPFSSMAGPHFNALARSFPDLKMVALDALKFHSVNTQYGIVGVPTIILFHNGRPVAKFNGTEYTLNAFIKFTKMYTGLKEEALVVHSQDFQGPVPSVTDKELDIFLLLSWAFIIICALFFCSRSAWWKNIVENVQNNWREAEAQHEHAD